MGAAQHDEAWRGGTPASDTAGAQPVPLLGAVTGYAKEVVQNIRRSAVSRQMKDFLLEVYARSFGNAGFQRRAGRSDPGGSCEFRNVEWAHEFGIHRQHMYRLRVRAEELGMLRYIPDPLDSTQGRLVWNLAFKEWLPLDAEYRRARYARPGAGRKPKPQEESPEESNGLHEESNGLRSEKSNGLHEESNGLRVPTADKSNGLRNVIKRVTHDGSETGNSAASQAPKEIEEREIDLKEKKKKEDHDAAHAASSATQATPSKAKRPRKLTDEQVPHHQAEAVYINEVLAGVRAFLRVKQLPSEKQQRQGVRWFYTIREDGQPVPVEDLLEWYRLMKSRDFWDGKFLNLMSLQKDYAGASGDLAAYRETVARERQQHSTKGGTTNGERQQSRRSYAPPAPPDANADGEYAKFIKNRLQPRPEQQPEQPVAATAAPQPF